MRISKLDFDQWWSSPVALLFKKVLEENLIKLSVGTMTNAMARDLVQNAIEVGRYMATMEYLTIDHEYLGIEDNK